MLSKDYLIRLIQQATAVFARIVGLKQSGQYQEALLVIDQTLEQLLGMKSEFIKTMEDESLYQILSTNGTMDSEKLKYIAALFREEGDIYHAQNQTSQGNTSYIRSLGHYLTLNSIVDQDTASEYSKPIEELMQKISAPLLPNDVLWKIFCFWENEKRYGKANEIIVELAGRPEGRSDTKREMITFYERLLEKTPKELAAGGITREQIKKGLKGCR
jgi:hypothetical protein